MYSKTKKLKKPVLARKKIKTIFSYIIKKAVLMRQEN